MDDKDLKGFMSYKQLFKVILWVYTERKKRLSIRLQSASFQDFVYHIHKKKFQMGKIVTKRFKKMLITLRSTEIIKFPRVMLFKNFIGMVDNEND